jgi:SHS2 domain-containing protein
MYWLAGAELMEGPREEQTFETEGLDSESLLVAFLSELVYYAEQENLGFDDFDIRINDGRLKVEMGGAPFVSFDKAIKAVTWHNLKIKETVRGLEVEIVFDV